MECPLPALTDEYILINLVKNDKYFVEVEPGIICFGLCSHLTEGQCLPHSIICFESDILLLQNTYNYMWLSFKREGKNVTWRLFG